MSSMFRFGCGHVIRDETIHEASWGARLIYSEVIESPSGKTPVVWDRQTPEGEPESVRLLFPVIDRAIDEFRENRYERGLSSDGRGRLCWRDGRALVVMSPQGSYGYLYVTALLERVGHENETKLAEFVADLPLDKQYGNWPPEVVAAREEEERKWNHERILGNVAWKAQDARWAQRKVWSAKTDRSKAIAQKKADKATDEAAEARRIALESGYTEAEIDDAIKNVY